MISQGLWKNVTLPNHHIGICIVATDTHSIGSICDILLRLSFGTFLRQSSFIKCHQLWPWKYGTLTLTSIPLMDLKTFGQHSKLTCCSFGTKLPFNEELCSRALDIQNLVSSRFAVGMPQEAKLEIGVLDAILDASPKTPQRCNTESL